MFSRPDFVHKVAKSEEGEMKLFIEHHFNKCTRLWCLLFFFFKCYQGILYVGRDPAWHYAMPLLISGHFQGQTAAI